MCCGSVSVCLSVTSRCCTKVAEHRIMKRMPPNSPGTSQFCYANDFDEIPIGSPPTGVQNAAEIGKTVFRRDKKSPAQTLYGAAKKLCSSATVVCIHNGGLAKQHVVSSTTLVVDEVCL